MAATKLETYNEPRPLKEHLYRPGQQIRVSFISVLENNLVLVQRHKVLKPWTEVFY